MKRLAFLTLTLVITTTACATSDTTTTTAGTSTPPTSTTEPNRTTSSTSPATAATTTAAPSSTTTTTAALPGEPIDFGPRDGDVIVVAGVAFDDVLNVRAAPGIDQAIVAELAPTFDELIALGSARSLPNSIWYEVEANGVTGWVSARYVGYMGLTDDLTSLVVDELGGIPSAETMLDMADLVASVLESEEPASTVTVTVAPDVGDLGEVTIDIIGLGDDAQVGWRLVIFAQPDDGGEGFSLMAVEGSVLCGRGVTDDGLCV